MFRTVAQLQKLVKHFLSNIIDRIKKMMYLMRAGIEKLLTPPHLFERQPGTRLGNPS